MTKYEIKELRRGKKKFNNNSKVDFIFVIFLAYLVNYVSCGEKKVETKQQRLLLLSFGGFRHDYIETYGLQNFAKFIDDQSARASFLNPQFTTQSFPNHWSMATGAFVETHGIVADNFYDPQFDEFFQSRLSGRDLKWWNQSEPFWLSAVRQGLRTGVYFWPGSESTVDLLDRDQRQIYTVVTPYNENTPFGVKMNQSLKWLSEDNYKFVCVYHSQPDLIAHKYGINTPRI